MKGLLAFVKREVRPDERAPFGFGAAWRNYAKGTFVCFPVPFNILANFLRNVWWWLARYRPLWMDKRIQQIRLDALEQGRAEGKPGLLFLCGRRNLDEWGVLGIYSTRGAAVGRCRQRNDFVATCELDADLEEERIEWPDVEWPLLDYDQEIEAISIFWLKTPLGTLLP